MKVTIKYEESEDKDLHMTLRLTVPAKYVAGPTRGIVKLFVDHYNKKHEGANQLDVEALHLKIVGGHHLTLDALVSDSLREGVECYLMGEDAFRQPPPAAPVQKATELAPTASTTSSSADAKKDGKIRCKRFGCQKFFDPEGEPQECVHHKAPPIFHETAKWWSCCPDTKAYDWEEFMKIPGCERGFCSATPEGQHGSKRFLGGCDLRGDSAPIRLDADAPRDPRHRISDLRKGLLAIGVDAELFDMVWSRLASETDDSDRVCEKFRSRFAALLNRVQ